MYKFLKIKKVNLLAAYLFAVSAYAQPNLTFNSVVTHAAAISESPYKPLPGSVINHTQVMFEYPAVDDAVKYKVVVTELTFLTGKRDTIRKIVVQQNDATTATLVNGLKFATLYEWYYRATDAAGKVLFTSRPMYFSVITAPFADPKKHRLAVQKPNEKATGLITLDFMHSIANRAGKVVWTLPAIPDVFSDGHLVRDIRVSPQGTITLLTQKNIYELDVDGQVLWKGPNDGKSAIAGNENFHHDFKRLPSGNFMVLSNETIIKNAPGTNDTVSVKYGTIVEYGFYGKPLWTWSSKSYFKDSEIFNGKDQSGKPQASLHLNAFSVDEKGEYVYAGFRDLNRILKIEKKTGNVVGDYGGGLFWHQHDANILPDGTIALFNNDSVADPKISSSALIIAQPATEGGKATVIWKLDCKTDPLTDGKSVKMGSMDLLPNGNYLINMGSLPRIVEVNKSKTILWQAAAESWSEQSKKWVPAAQYRTHYASSLYPCYFTGKCNTSADGKNLLLTVYNEGTEADKYVVTIQEKSRKMPAMEIGLVNTTKAGNKTDLQVDLLPLKLAPGNYDVKISSVTNPDFFRTIPVTLIKIGE